MNFSGMFNEVVAGLTYVVQTLVLGGDYYLLGMAAVVIVLAALFMSSLEQLVSTTVTALFAFVVLQVVVAAFESEWDFVGPANGVWDSFAGSSEVAAFTFFMFFMYFIVFAIAIAIVNILKGMVSG